MFNGDSDQVTYDHKTHTRTYASSERGLPNVVKQVMQKDSSAIQNCQNIIKKLRERYGD